MGRSPNCGMLCVYQLMHNVSQNALWDWIPFIICLVQCIVKHNIIHDMYLISYVFNHSISCCRGLAQVVKGLGGFVGASRFKFQYGRKFTSKKKRQKKFLITLFFVMIWQSYLAELPEFNYVSLLTQVKSKSKYLFVISNIFFLGNWTRNLTHPNPNLLPLEPGFNGNPQRNTLSYVNIWHTHTHML